MAGILASQDEELETVPEGQEVEPASEEAAPPQGEITPQAIRSKLELPDNLKDAYDRVVLAGMKVMFSKETNEMAMQSIAGEGPIDERLATGVATLMGTLIKESNGTMPPPIVIPAGIELIAAAGDYLKKGNLEAITDDDIAGAMADYVQLIFQQGGAKSPQDMQAMLQGAQGGGQPAAPMQEEI